MRNIQLLMVNKAYYTLELNFKDDKPKGSVVLKKFKAGIATNVTPQKAFATIQADNR